MKLRRNEFCPIHKSVSCCGRKLIPKPKLIRLGVQRIEDSHHPRGYRELRSPAEMRKLLNRKIVEQDRKCALCHEEFTDYNDIVPDPKCDLNHKVAVWQRYALNGTDVLGQPATASLDTTEIRSCIARASNAEIARRRLPTGHIS